MQVIYRRAAVVFTELTDESHICPAKSVDRLIRVTYHTEVRVMLRSKSTCELILRIVEILVLIHAYVAKTILVRLRNVRIAAQKPDGTVDQIIYVKGVLLLSLYGAEINESMRITGACLNT